MIFLVVSARKNCEFGQPVLLSMETFKDFQVIFAIFLHLFLLIYPINKIIYLKTSPEVCKDRIEQRGRAGEDIPIEYLTRCHDYHNRWIETNRENLVIDGNAINNEDNVVYENWKNQVKLFLQNS